MSYLALARKYRPRRFSELAGQEHVLRALMNALETGRVHHAFLFTGTRGVGKTTIARILAKSLNCETGVTAQPCGVCGACREIDEGRFVDLLEVDAASRTKVDDTRELLDNVQYAPARGRYKVYLIDEVHMLSTHSFNALLKTLEEPPPHVKFLLATTDPQKLPVTVLSRCLQFSLKRLPPALIVKRMTEVLEAETIPAEPEALRLIARAAEGSMRDALSLLDQVIAFGSNAVTAQDARSMLGTLDRTHVLSLLQLLVARDAAGLLKCIVDLDEHVADYREVLADLAALLQRVALLQAVPDLSLDDEEDAATLSQLASSLTPADVQLFYQIALTSRRDLDLAPDARGGFEMALLRMLAFQPADGSMAAAGTPIAGKPVHAAPAPVTPLGSAAGNATQSAQLRNGFAASGGPTGAAAARLNAASTETAAVPRSRTVAAGASDTAGESWPDIVAHLNLQGPVSQLAAHSTLAAREGATFKLLLDAEGETFRRPALEDKLRAALTQYLGEPVKLLIEAGTAAGLDTPARRNQAQAEDRLRVARASIEEDPNVNAMRDLFKATVQPESVKPVD